MGCLFWQGNTSWIYQKYSSLLSNHRDMGMPKENNIREMLFPCPEYPVCCGMHIIFMTVTDEDIIDTCFEAHILWISITVTVSAYCTDPEWVFSFFQIIEASFHVSTVNQYVKWRFPFDHFIYQACIPVRIRDYKNS